MKALLYYLVQVIVTSGILYAYYHFALRNKKFHRYNRFYLLAATVISITIPFLNIPVYFTQTETESSFVLQTLTVISSTGPDAVLVVSDQSHYTNWFSWQNLSYSFYILIASIALLRIIVSLIKIRRIAKNNPVERLDNIHFVNTNEPGTPFSFFRWLFWNSKIELRSEKGEQIFRHELFHIRQKHSWDIMYMELLTVVCWINPFFHLMKKEVKAIHEFLADQFAITENTKWQYAELLLMQVLNTNQQLVNPFFHNQIKRRIAMITISKKPSYQYLRKLMVLPVSLILLILFAFTYKTKRDAQQTKDNEQAVAFNDTAISKNDFIIKDNVTIKDENGKTIYLPNATMIYKGYDSKDTSTDLLVYVDGKLYPELKRISDIDKKIKPADIELICILKGKKATDKYGEKGKNGVMEIITKENEHLEEIKKSMLKNTHLADTAKPAPDTIIWIKKAFPSPQKKSPSQEQLNVWQDSKMYGVWFDSRRIKNNELTKYKPSDFVLYNVSKLEKNATNYGNHYYQVTLLSAKQYAKSFPGDSQSYYMRRIVKDTAKPVAITADKIYGKVEIKPSFPGGDSAWKRYLEKNANGLVATDSGAPAGVYKVMVQFIVHEDGSLSDVKALTNHGYGMEKESMRVINAGPKWIPAKQNGHIVTAYVQQPITFAITEEDGASDQDSLQTTTTTAAGIPGITVAELKKASVYKLLQIPVGTQIVRYFFTIDLANGDIVEIPNSDNKFNEATIIQINKATAGRIIAFDNIRIIENGKEKPIPSKVYSVTN